MKILSFSASKKHMTLSEKVDRIEKQLTMKLSSEELELEKKKIDVLVNAVKSWFIIQFSSELSKLNYKEKNIIDFMDLSTCDLLDIYDENDIINDFNRGINKKLFQEYENNSDFKEKIHECALYKLLEDEKNIEYGIVFCKTFDLKLELAMKYIPKESLDDTYIIEKYVDNGGDLNINFYPNYFDKTLETNIKDRFAVENLRNKVYEINEGKRRVKIA